MARIILLVALIFACSGQAVVPSESDAFSPERVLKSDFRDEKYWPAGKAPKGRKSIEFCGGDWCQEVSAKNHLHDDAAWSAVFIMFYFFDSNEEFRERRKYLAKTILSDFGPTCEGGSLEIRASCVLNALQEKYGFEYRRVQYDVGSRCFSIFNADPPHFSGQGECMRLPERSPE